MFKELMQKVKELLNEIVACWKIPASGDYVPYKEIICLSVGWLGMRLATQFSIGFGVGNAFTGLTLKMTNRDLLILNYVCMAIGYILAPINSYIIDNLNSRDGKYRVYIKLAIPSAALALLSLFLPYERMPYFSMVVTLFVAGQVHGYIQNWYSTGVSNLIFTISPNSKERTRIMAVTSLVHNFAPSVAQLFIPILSDLLADGDLYNISTYRKIYPFFIVIGAGLSLYAYYGTKERIIVPKSRMTQIGFWDALKAVVHNRIFWVRSLDAWNDFLENTKGCLLDWLFYYGKRGPMSMVGIINTITYNSSMWAMIASPWLIKKFGKKKLKIFRNIIQTFCVFMLFLTYKKSLIAITVFLWLDRFCGTDEVLDRSIESDMRDYQQYISGERIDGAFGMLSSYINGGVGAVTNLFVPWVYRKYGFDGTDYSVLEAFDANGNPKDNVLYELLDVLMKIATLGAAVDILPWLFYNISETGQRSYVRVLKLRTMIEDKKNGLCSDEAYAEGCEAVLTAREYGGLQKLDVGTDEQKAPKKAGLDREEYRIRKKEAAAKREAAAEHNDEIEIAQFVLRELNRFETPVGRAQLEICRRIADGGLQGFYLDKDGILEAARAIPEGETKEEKTFRRDTVSAAMQLKNSARLIGKYYPDGIYECDPATYENAFDLPENTPEEKKRKKKTIAEAKRERKIYGRAAKPYLFALRMLTLAEGYADIDDMLSGYGETKARLDEERRSAAERNALEAARRREEITNRLNRKKLASKH